jgi:hypothetical protein
MGRYAFFSTGLEYKFRFGVQESYDMCRFGGVLSETIPNAHYTQAWTESDRSTALAKVQELAEFLGDPVPDFSVFEKSLEGTYQLRDALYPLYTEDHSEELVARFLLGCLLYHQLLYTDPLQVEFEG